MPYPAVPGSDPEERIPQHAGIPFSSLLPFLIPAGVLLVGVITVFASVWLRIREPSPITFSTEASPSSGTLLHVDVAGSVQTPNVYILPAGSRVQDVLSAAGGLSAQADREWVARFINRAAPVADGAKLYIPRQGEQNNSTVQNKKMVSGEVAGETTSLINVNTATQTELDTLPGIGEKTAEKIIAGRPYNTIEALVEKKIVGQSVFGNIRNLIRVY